MRKKFILASLLTICSLAMIGCQGQQKSPQDSALADTAMINIYLLAGRMGMRVTTVENEKIIFSNDTDSVVIYRTIGKVYLNYEYLAETGKIKNIDGLPCIRASLGDEISAKLKKPKPKIVKLSQNAIIIPKARIEEADFKTGDMFKVSCEGDRIILSRL